MGLVINLDPIIGSLSVFIAKCLLKNCATKLGQNYNNKTRDETRDICLGAKKYDIKLFSWSQKYITLKFSPKLCFSSLRVFCIDWAFIKFVS